MNTKTQKTQPQVTGKKVGRLSVDAAKLLDRSTLALKELQTDAAKKMTEEKYAKLLPIQDFTQKHQTLGSVLSEFRKNNANANLFTNQSKAEMRKSIENSDKQYENDIKNAEIAAKQELDTLEAELKMRKKYHKEHAAELKRKKNAQRKIIRDAANKKIENFTTQASKNADALLAAYNDLHEVFRETESLWAANCNEDAKQHLIQKVFPKLSRKSSGKKNKASGDEKKT